MFEEIKKTDIWTKLMSNPKFKMEFEKLINNRQININELVFSIKDNRLIITYNSEIKNRDLDCQYRLFLQKEFSIDNEDNLVVDELSGTLESNYGFDFNNTSGGVINTHYSIKVYDMDGIELNYQSYSDKYHLDDHQFKYFKNDLQSVVLSAYNPNLRDAIDKENETPYPRVIGRDGRFVSQVRSQKNLGIVEVTKYNMTYNARINDLKNELYFNTFLTSRVSHNPELINIINGFPFAVLEDNILKISKEYSGLGLTSKNYKEVARDRFLKELQAEKKEAAATQKYDLMIKRLENEVTRKKRGR